MSGPTPLSHAEAVFQSVAAGKGIPAGFASVDALLSLAKSLKNELDFNHASRILRLALDVLKASPLDPKYAVLIEQLTICTYKDPDLSNDDRFEAAFATLQRLAAPGTRDDFSKTSDPAETYGVAGAIFKAKWQVDGDRRNLERAAGYYLQGYAFRKRGRTDATGREPDWTYPGINAAFVLDQLASLLRSDAARSRRPEDPNVARYARQADAIRKAVWREKRRVLDGGPPGNWWDYATAAEAGFGLGKYDDARADLAAGKALPEGRAPRKWELESTSRQLAALNVIRPAPPARAGAAVDVLVLGLGISREAARSAFRGKIGLALSGGGFRASLYHIGVLARLAEVDLLRDVDVISCVSGGSIVGAYYYLKVRALLQEKCDGEITRDDYAAIVRDVAREFLTSIRNNIRTRMFSDPLSNLKMLVNLKMLGARPYTRTRRISELYESDIYAGCLSPRRTTPWLMSELKVTPKGDPSGDNFQPKFENWRRKAKVPMLVLNATSLNTGHGWQFTATYMGEPPGGLVTEVDANDRLRRVYYRDLDGPLRDLTLGTAVAASAGVPVIFTPIELEGMYPGITVRLSDGGVYDNQGVMSLLEQGCDVLVVSDACGQLVHQDEPGWGMPSVATRSNDILMDRVRGAEFRHLSTLKRGGVVRNLMFVHLKKGLASRPVDWVGCRDPHPEPEAGALTDYGVRRDLQLMLSAVRTDLDAFGDREAQALMASGYLMTEHYLDPSLGQADAPRTMPAACGFEALFAELDGSRTAEPPRLPVETLLDAGRYQFVKLWRINGTFGYDLKLIPALADAADIPATGVNLIVVAEVGRRLHVRVFDDSGVMVVDTDETALTDQARRVNALHNQLRSLWPPHRLTAGEKDRVVSAVTAVVGHACPLEVVKSIALLASAAALGVLAYVWWSDPAVRVGRVAFAALAAALPGALLVVSPRLTWAVWAGQTVRNFYQYVAVALFGAGVVTFLLRLDRRYLDRAK